MERAVVLTLPLELILNDFFSLILLLFSSFLFFFFLSDLIMIIFSKPFNCQTCKTMEDLSLIGRCKVAWKGQKNILSGFTQFVDYRLMLDIHVEHSLYE